MLTETDKNQQQCIPNPEIWGGIECTINRVRNKYFDQLELVGHYYRDSDIDQIAELGIKSIRYPVLWEKHQPEQSDAIDWAWTEGQLNKIKEHNITPIAGLLHHGSGPSFTSLSDKNFPALLAKYAKQVAQKFPWLEYYTPVNEPLTTARFSGLYGFWYPHRKNDVSFVKMLLNQIKGIVLSMQEIRKINPAAKLVQTEDLGKTYSTPFLAYQAKFENLRRWLTFDLLCGKVDSKHPMWGYLRRLGIEKAEILFFKRNPCPPDIMGFNYYVTSERYIDENYRKYEKYTHGGNDLHKYADVEAVRVEMKQQAGLKTLLREAWERYHLPIAITEAHLNCTREEQMRWFNEIYTTCKECKNEGIDIQAVTAWSLLGAYGWDSLLTNEKMNYELGAFDIRSGSLRITALGHLIQKLSQSSCTKHPALDEPGWWKRHIRLISSPASAYDLNKSADKKPIIIIGKTGTLGKAFARSCALRRLNYVLLGRQDVDITRTEQIEKIIREYRPWAIINTAGYVRVDDAEAECDRCFNENFIGAELLAHSCNDHNIRYLTFSSDLVFDGAKGSAYVESDTPNPINVYGESKLKAERAIAESGADALVVRTSAFFNVWDEYNFVHHVINSLINNQPVQVADDIFISPTFVPDLVNASLDLLIDKEKGLWHLTNNTEVSWGNFAEQVAEYIHADKNLIELKSHTELNWIAKRPANSALTSERGTMLPTLENAMDRFFKEWKSKQLISSKSKIVK